MSLPWLVMRAAMGFAKKRECWKPRQPYILLAVSLSAFCRMSCCCSLWGSVSFFMRPLTCLRRSTNIRSTRGSTPCWVPGGGRSGSASASPSPPLFPAPAPSPSPILGCSGLIEELKRSTVVKHRLNSCMMEGYSELKSRSSTYLSYRPRLGSSTSPPEYAGLRFPLPDPAALVSSSSSASSSIPPSSSCSSFLMRTAAAAFLLLLAATFCFSLNESLSGTMYFKWWNSCSSRNSLRSARAPFSVRAHTFPAMLVSCFVRGTICISNMRRSDSRASLSV
mmetsp:Transcript_24099/g.39605  ORF Transcript_24099/g.39605 Transcript_24099/m.39605 type:complete len:279 (-) Transcript_24099:2416-3252(-)